MSGPDRHADSQIRRYRARAAEVAEAAEYAVQTGDDVMRKSWRDLVVAYTTMADALERQLGK